MPAADSRLALATWRAHARIVARLGGGEPIQRHLQTATWLLEDA